MRRGGRARLKASDSKSDRGASPSGVQILSPPPLSLHLEAPAQGSGAPGSGSSVVRLGIPGGACVGLRRPRVGQSTREGIVLGWRGGRVAEGAALEMPCTGNCTVGSNPTPSAIFLE